MSTFFLSRSTNYDLAINYSEGKLRLSRGYFRLKNPTLNLILYYEGHKWFSLVGPSVKEGLNTYFDLQLPAGVCYLCTTIKRYESLCCGCND